MKRGFTLILAMGFAASLVIILDQAIDMPDELSGILYFISIGLAASSVLNYYKSK
ncbi:MAG: hypothetical protein HOC46_06440 [Candidatus Marinimicrobia bacterium]|jgi:hypothetical protein|nr:hypothetical protein [Candidatus Neomarinimicrobiota bacterium]